MYCCYFNVKSRWPGVFCSCVFLSLKECVLLLQTCKMGMGGNVLVDYSSIQLTTIVNLSLTL